MKGSSKVINSTILNDIRISWVRKEIINSDLFIELIRHILNIWRKLQTLSYQIEHPFY